LVETVNVVIVCDGVNSSATIISHVLAKHSQNNIVVCQWDPTPFINCADVVWLFQGSQITHPTSAIPDMVEGSSARWLLGCNGYGALHKWNYGRGRAPPPHVNPFSAVQTSCRRLHDIMVDYVKKPTFLAHSGFDSDLFYPLPPPKDFCIGWAGDARNGAKMYDNFAGLPFPKKTVGDYAGGFIPHLRMPGFYSTVSVYVSTSEGESSPLPPREAAACGRPVVAVDVGDLYEWVPPRLLVEQSEWGYRTHDSDKLIPIIESLKDPELYCRAAEDTLKSVQQFSYSNIINSEYDPMFREVAKLDK